MSSYIPQYKVDRNLAVLLRRYLLTTECAALISTKTKANLWW